LKVGNSANNSKIDIKENMEELFNNYYFEKNSEKYDSLSKKNFSSLKELPKINLLFLSKRKIIYSLSIFGFVIILGLILFFISQS